MKRRASIRWRIQKWNALVLLGMALVMATGFFFYEKSAKRERLVAELSSLTSSLIPRTIGRTASRRIDRPRREGEEGRDPGRRRPPPRGGWDNEGIRSIEDILGNSAVYYIVWERDDREITRSENAPAREAYPVADMAFAETMVVETDTTIEARHSLPGGRRIVVAMPIEAFNAELFAFGFALACGSGLVVLLGVTIGWILLGRETRKIRKISESAVRIAGGDLSQRIPSGESGQELEELVGVLNDAFGKIEGSFDQQVRFTADASHELRTPLTAILTKCQSTLIRPRSADQYKEAVSTCMDVGSRMKDIVESLLDLARFDSGENALACKRVSLGYVVQESEKLLRPLIEERYIFVESDLQEVFVEADPLRLQRVCLNLIGNAIKYSESGGTVHLRVFSEGDEARLVVADRGPGIAEEDIDSLFDRFYTGKSQAVSGDQSSGLGLAVSKAIVVAHGGSIGASNRISGGALFCVRLPLQDSDVEREEKPEGKIAVAR